MSTSPIVLVDAMNLAYRSHYAFSGLSYEGQPTGTYYGFISQLDRIRAKISPRIILCWDHRPSMPKKQNWRLKLFPEYKSKRVPNEATAILQTQIEPLAHMIWLLGYGSTHIPGLEADDLFGLYTGMSQNKFLIFSSDKDVYQLLDHGRVEAMTARRGKSFDRIKRPIVEREYGFSMALWPHYLSLGGDTSDDIGVLPRIGPKRAQMLVRMGFRADRPWHKQPSTRNPDWEELWPQVNASYEVAHIPRRTDDNRLQGVFPGEVPYEFLLRNPDPEHRPIGGEKSRTEQLLVAFAEFGLSDFIAKRRKMILP